MPDLHTLAEIIAGPRWWTSNVPMAQADAIHRLTKAGGMCYRHAALIADLLAHEIRRELAFRSVPPGTVAVWRVAITDPPFDEVSGNRFRKTLGRLRNFVQGTELSAVLEHDREHRRIRVTFTLLTDVGQPGTTLDIEAIHRTTPRELITVLREAERRRIERVG